MAQDLEKNRHFSPKVKVLISVGRLRSWWYWHFLSSTGQVSWKRCGLHALALAQCPFSVIFPKNHFHGSRDTLHSRVMPKGCHILAPLDSYWPESEGKCGYDIFKVRWSVLADRDKPETTPLTWVTRFAHILTKMTWLNFFWASLNSSIHATTDQVCVTLEHLEGPALACISYIHLLHNLQN